MSPKKRGIDEHTATSHKSKKPKLTETAKKNLDAKPPASAASNLNTNEVDFPRGGGSSFTPLEHKLIRDEAIKEAEDELFKSSETTENIARTKTHISITRRKDETQKKSDGKSNNIRVEHLNYKRVVVGMKILCQIISIQPLGLIVSLPNQLLGHIPITQISSQLTTLLENIDDNDENHSSDGESGDEALDRQAIPDVPDLSQLFRCGQYVRAVVTNIKSAGTTDSKTLGPGRDPTEKASRRVELSLKPDQVNLGVAKVDLQPGFSLTASVKSIEDHGYILDIGINDMSAFLSFKDMKEDVTEEREFLQIGSLVDIVIEKISGNGRTCNAINNMSSFSNAYISEVSTVTSVLPGVLVNSLITSVLPTGLNLLILGYFVGTIDLYHLPVDNPDSRYKVGQKIKARVLYDVVGSSPPQFLLSLADHIISLSEKQRVPHAGQATQTVLEAFPVGTVLQNVRVSRVETEKGLVVEVESGIEGHIHISHVSDEHISSLSPTSGIWKLGTIHTARVIGYHALDGILQLSLRPSVLEQKFLQVSDVKVGELIKGTVKKLTDTGLFVSMSGNVDGVIWPSDFADIPLKHPQKRFKPGSQVKARVLIVDQERRRITLTAKKTLVESDLPIISRIEDASPGTVSHGVVRKIFDKSLLIGFYNNVKAVVSAREASEAPVGDLAELFYIGKPVKVRIVSVDISAARIVASMKITVEISTPIIPSVEGVEIGNTVTGVIHEIHKENALLILQPTNIRALISLHNLANHRTMLPEELRSTLNIGEELQNLIVVARNPAKGFVIVANRPRSNAAISGGERLKFNTLIPGHIVIGQVARYNRQGFYVQFSGNVRGSLHPTDLSDNYDESCLPSLHTSIRSIVVSIDRTKRHLTLSTRPSRMSPDNAPLVIDREISDLKDLSVGETVRGFIKSVVDHGIFVALGRDIDARVQIKELYDNYIKEWKTGFKVNQVVKGRILRIDSDKKQVEMSFRSATMHDRPSRTIHDIKEGEVINGRVKKVEDFGVFVEIENSKLSGLCHKSELADNTDADVSLALRNFRENDKVKAIVLSIDIEKRRISFGLKPSYFEDVALSSNQDEDDDEYCAHSDFMEEGHSGDELIAAQQAEDDDDTDEVMDIDPNAFSIPRHTSKKVLDQPVVPFLQLQGGFQWSDHFSDSDNDKQPSISGDEEADNELSKRKRKRKRQIEYDVTADMQTKIPESIADFERHLLGSPNSSYFWIQYMSFQLQLSEIEKAREVGKRAIQTINIREEQEKLNVWIALLNLENTYGTEESLEIMFKDAAKHNDSKTVHLRLAAIFDQSNKPDKAEEHYKRTCKKFGQSSKVWALFGEHYFRRNEMEKARNLLSRSLQSLEKRKHLKTISKFAQLEYKMGSPERGKTIFEGIVDSHPKRWDLWSIYIDMETTQKNMMNIRYIFDRVLGLKMTSHKAKAFFKKWLEIERRIGDVEGAEKVKEKAVAWTRQAAGLVESK